MTMGRHYWNLFIVCLPYNVGIVNWNLKLLVVTIVSAYENYNVMYNR